MEEKETGGEESERYKCSLVFCWYIVEFGIDFSIKGFGEYVIFVGFEELRGIFVYVLFKYICVV